MGHAALTASREATQMGLGETLSEASSSLPSLPAFMPVVRPVIPPSFASGDATAPSTPVTPSSSSSSPSSSSTPTPPPASQPSVVVRSYSLLNHPTMQVTALRYGAPLVVDVDTNAFAEAVARHFSVSQAEFEAA